jgi:uncharacterized protein (TIGR02300 family)
LQTSSPTNGCTPRGIQRDLEPTPRLSEDIAAYVSDVSARRALTRKRESVACLAGQCTYIGAAESLRRLFVCPGLNDVSKPEIGTKRQCSNCGAKFFDLMKSPIVCPKCGTVHQVTVAAREVFRRTAKPVPETEVEDSGVELVSLEEREEGEEKFPAVVLDDGEAEEELAGDTLPPEEEEITGNMATLIDGDLDADEEG